MVYFRSLVLLLVLLFASAPLASSTPSTSEWATLQSALSTNASLHGPIESSTYDTECRTLGTDAYAISAGGNGICMHAHDCSHEFCSPESFGYDLPSYVADVRTEEDISTVLTFASTHSLEVSVKTTGHSYQGSSTKKSSLMVWMHSYPKDGTVQTDYVDSCGVARGPVLGIGGGETWDDVLEAVKDEYHIVTGGGRTVSAAGGWLMGGGLSFSSREYGIGVDQVIDFRLVLANGTAVTVDECSHPDLFWALRGGGGGTFGVVTHVHYKLHPLTSIVQVDFTYSGIEWAVSNAYFSLLAAVDAWLTFWIEKSPYLDSRWSGFFNMYGVHLTFAGTSEDADTTFLNEFNDWFDALDKSSWVIFVWGALPPSVTIHDSWYDYKGGAAAAGNPTMTDATGDAYAGVTNMAARLMPLNTVIDKPDEVKVLLFQIWSGLGYVNYFLGGNINNVEDDGTAVHPALRNSVWNIITSTDETSQIVRDFISNDVTGICYNHHHGLEPDWRNACWGTNYDRLNELKELYDPNHMFNCWHCVGYEGVEVDLNGPSVTPAPSPAPLICEDNQDKVTITIQTDGKGNEVYWFLKQFRATTNKFFNVAKSGKKKYSDDTLYKEEYCVKKNKCYKFIIKDTTSKDGLCCDFGEGFWKVELNGERLKTKKMIGVKKQAYQWGSC